MWQCDTFTKLPKDRICLFHVELFRSHTHPFGPCWLGSHLQSPAGVRSLPSGGPWCEASLNAWLDLSKTPTPSLSTISACISPFIHPAFLLLSSPGCYRETALAFAAARPLGQNQATWISSPPLLAFPAAFAGCCSSLFGFPSARPCAKESDRWKKVRACARGWEPLIRPLSIPQVVTDRGWELL